MSTEIRCTEEELTNWLKPILKKEGLENYKINVQGNSEKGDGYLGDITFVQVDSNDAENARKTYNFVIKSGKKSSQLREVIPIHMAFENEVNFYNEIIPEFVKFQEEKGIEDPFKNFPKCYGTLIMDDMEMLVLDNLKFRSFSVHNRQEPMDKDHILKIMKTYGKLHAISYALRDQKPEVFERLGSLPGDIMKEFNKLSDPDNPKSVLDDVEKVAVKRNELEIVQKCKDLKDQIINMANLTDPSDPYAVLLHGDCWNNNFMFKYFDADKRKLEDVCLIDFQITRLASPVYDLSYFLFTCLSPDDVKDFDEIVQVYYESLSDFLRLLGSDPNKMFPFEELMNQWKKFYVFGLVMMPGIIKACLSEPDEIVVLSEVAESDQTFQDAFSHMVKNEDEFARRTFSIMRLIIDKNFE